MGKFTQVQIWSKERDEHGFPRKFNVYHIGPTQRIGDTYSSPISRVRDSDLRIAPLPNRIKATTEAEAREKAVDHFKQEAAKMTLDCLVVELPET